MEPPLAEPWVPEEVTAQVIAERVPRSSNLLVRVANLGLVSNHREVSSQWVAVATQEAR